MQGHSKIRNAHDGLSEAFAPRRGVADHRRLQTSLLEHRVHHFFCKHGIWEAVDADTVALQDPPILDLGRRPVGIYSARRGRSRVLQAWWWREVASLRLHKARWRLEVEARRRFDARQARHPLLTVLVRLFLCFVPLGVPAIVKFHNVRGLVVGISGHARNAVHVLSDQPRSARYPHFPAARRLRRWGHGHAAGEHGVQRPPRRAQVVKHDLGGIRGARQ
mmetsp:Transcript_3743/g.9709  ORF Transcript_3743/g.9709 Transcript_3743/m.9709 type:complete len:220 (-) Transcript_3743:219-878(-)